MTLRALWISDAADANSGYSIETALTVPRLAALGHDVALLATFGHHGAIREWVSNVLQDGKPIRLRVYPGGGDPFANDVIRAAALDWKADIVITLKDSFVFNPQVFQGLRWMPLVPVDHEPVPPAVIERVHACYRPIAYAPQGFRALRAAGLDPAYAPHGYDPAVYNPQSQEEARRFLGLPAAAFLVGTVAVNRGGFPSRKAWAENLEGFARFAKDKPNAFYFLHTWLGQDGKEGALNLPHICQLLSEELGYNVMERIIPCNQDRYNSPGGFPTNYLHAFYNSLDVLNAVSLGEGFGIPQVEAQACGTPVIVSDFAAARDLCFGGWKVSRGMRFYDNQGARVFLPEPQAIADALDKAYQARAHPHMWAEKKREAIAGTPPYQIDRVIAEHWGPLLEETEQRIRFEGSRGVLRIVRPEEILA
jgi:glycosyltransferase involved in cell wall biosynthesis